MSTSLPEFTRTATETIERATKVFAERGDNYGDTWALENQNFAVLRSTLRRFGLGKLTPAQLRLLKLAALIDTKDDRLASGKWNPDHLDDGINYRAAYCTFRDEYEREQARYVLEDLEPL